MTSIINKNTNHDDLSLENREKRHQIEGMFCVRKYRNREQPSHTEGPGLDSTTGTTVELWRRGRVDTG